MMRKESSGVDTFTSRKQAYWMPKLAGRHGETMTKSGGWGVPNFNMYISIFYVCPQWFSICIVSTDFLGGTQPFLLLPQVFLKVSLRVPHVLSPCLFFVGPFLSMPTYLHVCCYFNGFRYVVFRFCVSGNRRNC